MEDSVDVIQSILVNIERMVEESGMFPKCHVAALPARVVTGIETDRDFVVKVFADSNTGYKDAARTLHNPALFKKLSDNAAACTAGVGGPFRDDIAFVLNDREMHLAA